MSHLLNYGHRKYYPRLDIHHIRRLFNKWPIIDVSKDHVSAFFCSGRVEETEKKNDEQELQENYHHLNRAGHKDLTGFGCQRSQLAHF